MTGEVLNVDAIAQHVHNGWKVTGLRLNRSMIDNWRHPREWAEVSLWHAERGIEVNATLVSREQVEELATLCASLTTTGPLPQVEFRYDVRHWTLP